MFGVNAGEDDLEHLLKNPSVSLEELLLVPGLVQLIQKSDDLIAKFLSPTALIDLLRILQKTTDKPVANMVRDVLQSYVDTLSPLMASSITACELVFELLEDRSASFAFGIASSFMLRCFRMYPDEMSECLRLSPRMNELSLKHIEELGIFQLLTDIVEDDRIDASAFIWNCWVQFIGPDAAKLVKRRPACVYLDEPHKIEMKLTQGQRRSVLMLLVKYLEGKPQKDIEAHVKSYICAQDEVTEEVLDLAIAIGEDEAIAEKVFELVRRNKHVEKAVQYLARCVKLVSFDKFEFVILKVLLMPKITNIAVSRLLAFVKAFLQNPENQVNEMPKIVSYVWNQCTKEHDIRKPAVLTICTLMENAAQLPQEFRENVLAKWARDDGLEESFVFPAQAIDSEYISGLLHMFE